jgi:hypothetical protein
MPKIPHIEEVPVLTGATALGRTTSELITRTGRDSVPTSAIEQWLYEPALQDREPVAVCFTVFVDFELDRLLGGQPAVRTESMVVRRLCFLIARWAEASRALGDQ